MPERGQILVLTGGRPAKRWRRYTTLCQNHHLRPRDQRRPPGTPEPRAARALDMLLDEINAQPPSIPGDKRPITYRIAPQPTV